MEQSINFLCDDDKYLELLSKKKDSCILNFREQFKVCWRFFFCSNSSISYHRFKELVYSNKNPENAEEENFLSVLNEYNELLNSKEEFLKFFEENKISLNYNGDFLNFIKVYFNLLIKKFDFIKAVLYLNCLFLYVGIFPATYSKKEIFELMNEQNKENIIYNSLLNSKLFSLDYLNNLKTLKPEDVIKELKEIRKENSEISNLYLFGSFANGLYLKDSDIDIAIYFKEETIYSKKEEILKEIDKKLSAKLNRYIDLVEIMSRENDYLLDKIGINMEVVYE